MFRLVLAGSRCGAHMLRALAGGSTKEPAQDLKSASKISWVHLLGTWVDIFSALIGLELSYLPTDHLAGGNTSLGMDDAASILRFSPDPLYETGEKWCPKGAGQ